MVSSAKCSSRTEFTGFSPEVSAPASATFTTVPNRSAFAGVVVSPSAVVSPGSGVPVEVSVVRVSLSRRVVSVGPGPHSLQPASVAATAVAPTARRYERLADELASEA